ncbi:unnamed protein product [Mytilus coruscus]|uniref:Uncharacterized protein n=1 Tax=Mytilus coruscus TaxID=42192 RepID=A0A6J8CFI3_MYTCO|nr:unnamed protein product [Mytilus coruscus]
MISAKSTGKARMISAKSTGKTRIISANSTGKTRFISAKSTGKTRIISAKSTANLIQTLLHCTSITQTEVKKLRHDHNELERVIRHIESQLNTLEMEKLESLKKSIDDKLFALKENQLFLDLEKHERKYSILIYGIKQKESEVIWEVLDNFFVKELGIEKFKADNFPMENAHRILSRAPVVGQKRPDAIIVRFMHYSDKQFVMENAYKVANK